MSRQEHLVRLEVGQEAPDFKAQDLEGNRVTLRSLFGDGRTLLVFYRGEWCPKSKKELAGLARDYPKFQELNSRIVAVSTAELKKSKELARSLSLPFVVLSDPNLEAIDLYGVRVEGRDKRGSRRKQAQRNVRTLRETTRELRSSFCLHNRWARLPKIQISQQGRSN